MLYRHEWGVDMKWTDHGSYLKIYPPLKKQFVETFGEGLQHEGETYWLFPSVERIASLEVEDLTPTIEEIKELAKGWEGWQAYAVFYLWRSLY